MRAYLGTLGLVGTAALALLGCTGSLPPSSVATGGTGAPALTGTGGTGGLPTTGFGGAVAGAGGAVGGAAGGMTATGGTAGQPTVPDVHRASAAACSAALAEAGVPLSVYDGGFTGPRALDGGIITCSSDSDCPPCQNGQLDRCHNNGPQAGVECICDQCNTDQDCGPHAVCVCNQRGWSGYPYENRCVPSQCQVDADCGPGRFCSPSLGPCGAVAGYYCHTAADTCVSNAQCAPLNNMCIYSAATGAWGCGLVVCGG